jgi:hypothetical protein
MTVKCFKGTQQDIRKTLSLGTRDKFILTQSPTQLNHSGLQLLVSSTMKWEAEIDDFQGPITQSGA